MAASGIKCGVERASTSCAEVGRFFKDMDIVEPGVVWVPLWHPEEADDLLLGQPEESQVYGGVGGKR